MRATEKTRQKLSSVQTKTVSKAGNKRWKVDLNMLRDYIDYMEEDIS